MKIAALIFGLLGGLAILGLGSKWVSDYNQYRETIGAMQGLADQAGMSGALGEQMSELKKTVNAGYVMVGLGMLSILASFIVFKASKVSGIVFLASAIIPGIMAPKSFIFSFFLILAGIFALLAKPKTA